MCGRDLIYFLILINDKISCFLCGFGVLPDVEFVMFCAGRGQQEREEGSCGRIPRRYLTVKSPSYRLMGP